MMQYNLFDRNISDVTPYCYFNSVQKLIESGHNPMPVVEAYLYYTNEPITAKMIDFFSSHSARICDIPYALDYLCFNSNLNDFDSVNLLIQNGAQIRNDHHLNNALHAYVMSHQHFNSDIIRSLIMAGVDINHHGENGSTPLMSSVYLSIHHTDCWEKRSELYLDGLKMLIEQFSADPFLEDDFHFTITYYVMLDLNLDNHAAFKTIDYLKQLGLDFNKPIKDSKCIYVSDYLYDSISAKSLRSLYYRRISVSDWKLLHMCSQACIADSSRNRFESMKDVSYILKTFKRHVERHEHISNIERTAMLSQYIHFFSINAPLYGYSMDVSFIKNIIQPDFASFDQITFKGTKIANMQKVQHIIDDYTHIAQEKEIVDYVKMLKKQIKYGQNITFTNFNSETDNAMIYDKSKMCMQPISFTNIQKNDQVQIVKRNKYGQPINKAHLVRIDRCFRDNNRLLLSGYYENGSKLSQRVYVCNIDVDTINS